MPELTIKDSLRNYLKNIISEAEISTWFEPLQFEFTASEKKLDVYFPHSLFGDWFYKNKKNEFEKMCYSRFGNNLNIWYKIDKISSNNSVIQSKLNYPYGYKYRFENFYVSKKNRVQYEFLKNIAQKTEDFFNPLILQGQEGSGKSHLLKSIANMAYSYQSYKSILLSTLDEIINNISNNYFNNYDEILCKYNNYDLILIDNFETIKYNSKIIKNIYILFTIINNNKKQLIFATNTHIRDLINLDHNLKKFLNLCVQIDLCIPDIEIKSMFIQKFVKDKKLLLTKDAILEISKKFDNIEHIKSYLLNIIINKQFENKEINVNTLNDLFPKISEKKRSKLSVDIIIKLVSNNFQLDSNNLINSGRKQKVVLVRQIAMYLCRELLGLSYPKIGEGFGGMDHSTVLYSVKKIEKLQANNIELHNLLNHLKKKCSNL